MPRVVLHIAGSVATDASGVRWTACSLAPAFLMSPPMRLQRLHAYLSTGASDEQPGVGASDGFTTTTPLTAAPWVSASRSARQPPIEMPATKTCAQRAAKLSQGALGVGVPVRPARRGQVLPGRAVPGEPRRADGETGRGQVRGPRADRLRAAGEAVQDEDTDRPAVGGERLRAGAGTAHRWCPGPGADDAADI